MARRKRRQGEANGDIEARGMIVMGPNDPA
jgi:hypothetical protein